MVAGLVCPLNEGGSWASQTHPFPSQQLHCAAQPRCRSCLPRAAAGKGGGAASSPAGDSRGKEEGEEVRGGFNCFY